MGTAQASGVAMVVAARHGIDVRLHTPSEVKAAVTGSGRADKAQVAQMVTRLLRLDAMPKPADAADALALAICQIWRGGAPNRLQDAAREGGCPMIAFVRGRVAAAHPQLRRLDVGGVGYQILCTPGTIAGLRLGTEAAAGHVDGRPRGLHRRSTASPTPTSATCSSWSRPPAASAPRWRRRCSPCSPPDRLRSAICQAPTTPR